MTAEFQAGLPRRLPHEDAYPELARANSGDLLGRISLGAAIAGLVLPVLLAGAFMAVGALAVLIRNDPSIPLGKALLAHGLVSIPLDVLLFLFCQAVAFILGLVGIRSNKGKAAVVIAGSTATLLICAGVGVFLVGM